ncbi:MAG TPA: NAD(P)H-dependent oxidoreductase [Blastocatellia bacterium]|nr:NAD(P)H-dependent oxidoreductase [Blastocatellia bacterium]
MRDRPRILAISGSLRQHSYNRRVLKVAGKGAEDAGAEVTYIDLRDYPMPIYNPDDHERNGFDENALRLQGLIARHDGFLIATPEYNGSLPAALKNAIDWASRQSDAHPRDAVFPGKVAAMISASPGSFGGVRSLAHLRGVLTSVGVHVLPREIAVSFVADKFDGDGEEMTDVKMRAVLEGLGASLVEMLRKMRGEAGLLSAKCG